MGLENPTFVSDFVPANPASGDARSEGDDHIRRMKQALQNTFPGGSKAFYFPRGQAFSASFAISASDDGTKFHVSTAAGAVTITLPAVVTAGWEVTVMKASFDSNPIFIQTSSGTLYTGGISIAKTRRCLPGIPFRIYNAGSGFVVERCIGVPVGTMLDFSGGTLPVGYEWPNGQVLASAAANYPDYFAIFGTGGTVDMRGRFAAVNDALGGAAPAGRLTNATFAPNGQTLGATGGAQQTTLVEGNLPPHPHAINFNSGDDTPDHQHQVVGNTGNDSPDHTHPYDKPVAGTVGGGGVGSAQNAVTGISAAQQSAGANTRHAHGVDLLSNGANARHHHLVNGNTGNGNGASTPFSNVPPSIILSKILVVE